LIIPRKICQKAKYKLLMFLMTTKSSIKKLLIVESPAKAKTIEKYLGSDFKVVASVGHVRDLPKSNKKAIDIEAGFVPSYEISKGKEDVIKDIKSLVKKSEEVYLATDPDREGEAISWHLKEALGLKGAKRVTFNEITKDAVQEAMKHPREIDMNLKEAQEARRVLDRLVGYDLSGLIWKKVRYGLSAGRVQSPALRILMEREREIRAFIPEDFWTLSALVKNSKDIKDKFEVELNCTEEPREESEVKRILDIGNKGEWKVSNIKETAVKRSPRAPFITSTLQQTASSRFGMAPSRTMGIAQKLYEAGHITYMRPDSVNLSKQAVTQAEKVIEAEFGDDKFEARNYSRKSKNAQEAHEAIRPTDLSKESVGNTPEQKKLYKLIRARTLASQMKNAEVMRTKVIVSINDGEIPNFTVNGSRVMVMNWLLADPAARGEDVELPKLEVGNIVDLVKLTEEAKQTQPPNRYSEAGLIKELEKRGIGRPSTYASIIKTIVDRGYVDKEGKTLIPTDTGDVVSSFLEEHFTNYISDDFTAKMEDELDEIAEGKRGYLKTLKDFYGPFTKEIESKEDIAKLTTLGDADPKFKCPKCGSKMDIKLSRMGKFLSCKKYPDCDGALTIEGIEIKPDEPIGKHPETDEPIFVKVGRFGPYVQLGEGGKDEKGKKIKPKMASIPRDKNIEEVTVKDAVKYLSVPRVLGNHPKTGEPITAGIGRFGPFIVHEKDFRSLKEDSVYDIKLERALEIFAEPKKKRGGKNKAKKK
jgi:DNA topoisomerase-1